MQLKFKTSCTLEVYKTSPLLVTDCHDLPMRCRLNAKKDFILTNTVVTFQWRFGMRWIGKSSFTQGREQQQNTLTNTPEHRHSDILASVALLRKEKQKQQIQWR